MNMEVKLQRPMRSGGGRFSSVDHAFRQGANDTLKKLALLEHAPDPGAFLAQLFRTSNFGYGKDLATPKTTYTPVTPQAEPLIRFSPSTIQTR